MVLFLHCNDIKGDKGGAWVLVVLGFVVSEEWHECGNQCITKLAMFEPFRFAWLGYIWHANSLFPNPKHSFHYLNKNPSLVENSLQDRRLKNLSTNDCSNTYAIFSVIVNVLLWSIYLCNQSHAIQPSYYTNLLSKAQDPMFVNPYLQTQW
jgi:hypothetical protein